MRLGRFLRPLIAETCIATAEPAMTASAVSAQLLLDEVSQARVRATAVELHFLNRPCRQANRASQKGRTAISTS